MEKSIDGKEFKWTRRYGGLPIKMIKPVIEIPLLASHSDIQAHSVKVEIYLLKDFFKTKKLTDEIVLTQNNWKTLEYYIPEEINKKIIIQDN